MNQKADPATGVKVFSIGGRMVEQRQRCLGMTDEERRWRAQWLKDQVLRPDEPRDVPEFYKETTYFLRRLWKTPLYRFQKFLLPILGQDGAYLTRQFVGKSITALLLTYGIVYYFKYHTNNFETYRTVEVMRGAKVMLPNDPDFPNLPVKNPSDYYDQGFYSSVLCQEVHYEPPEPPETKPPPPPPPVLPEDMSEETVVCVPQEVQTEAEK